MLRQTILGILLIFASSFLQAEQKQSLDLIKQKIESYVVNELANQHSDDIQVSAEKIDPRLNLKACEDAELEVFNPYKTPMIYTSTVGIRCKEQNTHWTLYVPIRITLNKKVIVAKRALPKDTPITVADIAKVKMDVSHLKQGYFIQEQDVIGRVSKHNIPEGTALNAFNLQSAVVIHKGEQVSIQAINEMINVSMHGIALNDGALGDLIKVQNQSSKRVIEAQVSGTKLVRVTL
ncbi:flagellar basal body P-ring biosynthesis protein FlgA [Legionella massiliensis]|uniref:Flagella basal body P-ring formation protein FlgA n=1 Tax=Legionella massiliensis TaxID=1034943 RepID=A0A078L1D4_9GAMM|nr:flagellar basal body P-ring formation chaperone FlgA [Legionella massiliensis]CDZ79047.1 flagellar basal body P-ring biosynthesis protein FlgA [Legionella massiliensis]CEE14785.1 flagellar basal body P-ring biosynthesis protein FlgA [Legionella massiliensis]